MIKEGDLVMIVKPTICCGDSRSLGKTYKVLRVVGIETTLPRHCRRCGRVTDDPVAFDDSSGGYHISRLKKIDPPSSGELTGVPLRLKEPA